MSRRILSLLPLLVLLVALGCHSTAKSGVWKLEMMTDPRPPVAGASTLFRVLLTTGGGEPVDGGAAVIALSLPARGPSLVQVPLAPRGNGVYEGRATLPQAGNWTATITLSREGRTEIRRFPLPVLPAT